MSKLYMKLLSAFALGLLAATVGFIAFDGPPLVSAQTATNSAATGPQQLVERPGWARR